MSTDHYDILLLGGGAAGLTAAALFGSAGFRTLCVDRADPQRDDADLRTAALLTPAIETLEAAGIWAALAPHATALATMRILDDDGRLGRPQRTDFEAQAIDQPVFGWNVANSDLRAAARARVDALEEVSLAAPAEVVALQLGDPVVRATLAHEDGTTRAVSAALAVGADGRDSQLRAAMGVGARRVAYPQKALAFVVEHARPHGAISTEIYRTGGPFTLVPFKSPKPDAFRSSVVWMEGDRAAARLLALDDVAFEQEVNARSLGVLGWLTVVSQKAAWPMMSLLADRFHGSRAALIGEAAHVVPPIGAQGLNASIRDAVTLRDLLVEARRAGQDIGDVKRLAQLTRRRWFDVAARVGGTAALNGAAIGAAAPIRLARRVGLRALDAVGPLKTLMMRAGMGR